MIKLFHEPVSPLDLSPVLMLPLVILAHHPLLLELDLALLNAHLTLAQATFLNPELLTILYGLFLFETHLLLKVGACRGKLLGVTVLQNDGYGLFFYYLILWRLRIEHGLRPLLAEKNASLFGD